MSGHPPALVSSATIHAQTQPAPWGRRTHPCPCPHPQGLDITCERNDITALAPGCQPSSITSSGRAFCCPEDNVFSFPTHQRRTRKAGGERPACTYKAGGSVSQHSRNRVTSVQRDGGVGAAHLHMRHELQRFIELRISGIISDSPQPYQSSSQGLRRSSLSGGCY